MCKDGVDEYAASGTSEQTLLLALLSQITDELRARRDPEHLYTAAAIGGFGAVAWGVATVATTPGAKGLPFYVHPAIAGALGTLVVALAVIRKILREHKKYQDLSTQKIRISGLIQKAFSIPEDYLPVGLKSPAGRGDLWSVLVVAAAGVAAIWFCVTIWLSATTC